MNEEVIKQEVLDSLARIGKQWDLEESAIRVWGCMLLKSCPVKQREIEEGTGYSSGLVRISLQNLRKANLIKLTNVGGETHYSVNTSLTDGFGKFMKRFLDEIIKPMIELLSKKAMKMENAKVKENFHVLINELNKLSLAVLILFRIIEEINSMHNHSMISVDMRVVEDAIEEAIEKILAQEY